MNQPQIVFIEQHCKRTAADPSARVRQQVVKRARVVFDAQNTEKAPGHVLYRAAEIQGGLLVLRKNHGRLVRRLLQQYFLEVDFIAFIPAHVLIDRIDHVDPVLVQYGIRRDVTGLPGLQRDQDFAYRLAVIRLGPPQFDIVHERRESCFRLQGLQVELVELVDAVRVLPGGHIQDPVRALAKVLAHQVAVERSEQAQRQQDDKQEGGQQFCAQGVLTRDHDAHHQQQQAGNYQGCSNIDQHLCAQKRKTGG